MLSIMDSYFLQENYSLDETGIIHTHSVLYDILPETSSHVHVHALHIIGLCRTLNFNS